MDTDTDTMTATPLYEAPAQAPAARPARAGASRPSPSANRALVRKVAQLTLDVQAAPAPRREMLAQLLGLRKNSDILALVAAAHASGPEASAPVSSLLAVAAEPDDMDAAIMAVELAEDREAAKAVWSLLASLGMVGGGPIPSVAAKAGLAVARAARELGEANSAELAELLGLLR